MDFRTFNQSVEEATNTFIKYAESEGVPQDVDIKSRIGTQPAKYHTGLAKSTKIARDVQFKNRLKWTPEILQLTNQHQAI